MYSYKEYKYIKITSCFWLNNINQADQTDKQSFLFRNPIALKIFKKYIFFYEN